MRTHSLPFRSLESRRDRRGNFAFVLVLSLPVLLGMGAVAVDLGYQKVVRAELQAAADIAVAAGAEQLDGTFDGLFEAKQAAIRAAARNNADGRPVELNETNIMFGHWDPETREFVVSSDPADIDAMQVVIRREDVPTTFASIVFTDDMIGAQGRSTANLPPDTPAGKIACYLPFAVADCIFDTMTEEELNNHTFVLNPAGADNVAWARIGATPSADWVRDQLGDCTQSGEVRVGDSVGLNNGELSADLVWLARAIDTSETTWNTEEWGPIPPAYTQSRVHNYGNTLEGPILVFDGGPEWCDGSGGNYAGSEPLLGFTWAVVYDVTTAGGAADKNIKVKLSTLEELDIGTGTGGMVDGGILYDEPVKIVQ